MIILNYSINDFKQSREYILIENLNSFFEKKEYRELLMNIIKFSDPVSLRVIDWFVTNYSKVNAKKIYSEIKIDVYNNYKSQLKAYNKKLFDPFCRFQKDKEISKFKFFYDENNYILTTIGQLNFFRWAFQNDIIQYIIKIDNELKIDIKKRNININNTRKPKLTKNELLVNNLDNVDFSITF